MQKLIKSSEYSSGYFADSRKESLKFDGLYNLNIIL